MEPFLSICVPTYNRADLLDYCLTNLLDGLANSPKSFEIVVSDNGSTDHTADIVAKHRERKPVITSVRLPKNMGADANWLNVVRHAKGRYFIYHADDDSIIPASLYQHLDRLEHVSRT